MSIQDIPKILSSRERIDRDGLADDSLDDIKGSETINLSIQSSNGKQYHPISVINNSLLDHGEARIEDTEDVYEQGLCGIGVCQPRWSQCLANLNVFAIVYGITGIWMTTLSTLLGSQITSIERHLGISSSKSGMLLSSNEAGYLLAVILGSHLGKYSHIPRCLSASGVIFGIATIMMSFGRLMEPKMWQHTLAFDTQTNITEKQDTSSSNYLCDVASNFVTNVTVSTPGLTDNFQESSSTISWAFLLMMLALVLGGAVKSYRLPLLAYYIESNIVNKDRSGLMLGSSITAMILGPAIALFLGGYVSSLPLDLKETTMTNYDQRWIGAWWLGFIIVGLAAIAFSLPIMFFPRHIRLKKIMDIKENVKDGSSFRVMFKDLPKSFGRIFRRPIFVLSLVYACVEGFAFSGWYAFFQKYIETQFNKTTQELTNITGFLTLFSVSFGTFAGGFVTTKLKLEVRGCAVACLAVAVGTILSDSLYLLFGCKNSKVMGMPGERTPMMELCGCKDDIFLVCGDDDVTYVSPCLAGCTNVSGMIYTNCSAVGNGQVRPGLCDLDCNFYIPYLVLLFFSFAMGTFSIIPGFMLSIRSIEPQDQSLASGTAAFSQTLMGVLPSPLFFGRIIDSACTLWSPSGSCVLYDRERFRFVYQGAGIGLRLIGVIVMSILLWFAHTEKRRECLKNENKKETVT